MALFSDACTALVTLYNEKGLDFDSLGTLIERQLRGGVSALLILSEAGEVALLTEEEKHALIRFVTNEVHGRVPVICACGGESPSDALEECKKAEKLGIDALLVGAPAYLKPSQEGATTHLRYIADNVSTPVIIRNGDEFCLDSATIRRLCVNRRIVAVLDYVCDIGQVNSILPLLDDTFSLFCGVDSFALPMLSLGARGVVSVAANAFLPLICRLCSERTTQLHSTVCSVAELMCREVHPSSVKYILAKLGYIGNYYLRSPLPLLSDEKRRFFDGSLELLKAFT